MGIGDGVTKKTNGATVELDKNWLPLVLKDK